VLVDVFAEGFGEAGGGVFGFGTDRLTGLAVDGDAVDGLFGFLFGADEGVAKGFGFECGAGFGDQRFFSFLEFFGRDFAG